MATKEYLKLTTSFPEGWKNEYEFALEEGEKLNNAALYIRQLIREDMLKKKGMKRNKEDEILSLLKKISNGNITLEKNEQISNLKKNALKNIMKR